MANSRNQNQEAVIEELFWEGPYPDGCTTRAIRGFPRRARRARWAIERSTPTAQAGRSDRTPPGPSREDAERSFEPPHPVERTHPGGWMRPRDVDHPRAVDAAAPPVDAVSIEAVAEIPTAVAVAVAAAVEDASPVAAASPQPL